jgi:uncharacterized protein (DUF1778 family)
MQHMARRAEKRDQQLTIRIPRRLRDALDREAEADRRSVADIVVNMLEDRYAKRARAGR